MAVEQTASELAPGPQLPQGPVFHEENSEQDEPDMSSHPSKFITTRVSGVRTESHEPKTAASDASATYVSLPGAPLIPSGVYFPPYPPAGVYTQQLPQAPATASGSSTPSGHISGPSHIPSGSFLNLRAPTGTAPSPGPAPSLAAIFTQGSALMTSPDSATPSTATSLPSAAPPITPDDSEESPGGGDSPYTPGSVPRLPPILQVEKAQVTTTATQAASASRRRNEAHFVCPVPGCGSTFTRRFNLRGGFRTRLRIRLRVRTIDETLTSLSPQGTFDHIQKNGRTCANGQVAVKGLRVSMTASTSNILVFKRPSADIMSSFFRRHQALHSQRTQANVCHGCRKTFSRLDALNVSFFHHASDAVQTLIDLCSAIVRLLPLF
jgi:hypothetical protein